MSGKGETASGDMLYVDGDTEMSTLRGTGARTIIVSDGTSDDVFVNIVLPAWSAGAKVYFAKSMAEKVTQRLRARGHKYTLVEERAGTRIFIQAAK